MARTKTVLPGTTAASQDGAGWVTPSFRNALPHFLPLIVFPMVAGAAWWGSWWIVLPFAFVFANNLDSVIGIEERNMKLAETSEGQLFWYKLSVWIWAILWPVTLVFTLWQIFVAGRLSAWEGALLALLLVGMSASVFIVAHEFVHRRAVWERRLGEFLLASVSFPLYATEHVYIHHSMVCTPEDPESPIRGESFWHFYAKNLPRLFLSSWQFELRRLRRRRLPSWHYKNAFWRYFAETAVWYGLAWWMGGIWGILIFIVLCGNIIFQIRLADYIQHYGLRRIRLADGRFEPVQPHHIWGASYRLTNWLFYNAQRHPDHHVTSSRRYPLLQHHGEDSAPQLPGTYPAMMGLALFPKRWFETVDPLLDEQRARFYPQIKDWRVYDSPAFAARPDAFERIEEILAVSPRLAEWINQAPDTLDSLQTKEFTDLSLPEGFGPDPGSEKLVRCGLVRLYWTRELGIAEMKEQLADCPAQDTGEAVEAAREWANGKALQIGVHAVRGHLAPAEAATALSRIAEAAICSVLSAACEDFAERMSGDPEGGFCVLALGALADGTMVLGAELDILVLYEGSISRRHERLALGFLEALRAFSGDSLLFVPADPDPDRLPVYSLAGLREHCRTAGSADDLLALTSARCIFATADSQVEEHFEEARREILACGPARDALVGESLPLGTAAPGLLALEDMGGGIRDLERAARHLALNHVKDIPGIADPDAVHVFEIAGEHGLIAGDAAKRLREAKQLWRSLKGILTLVAADRFTLEAAPPQVQEVILQAAGVDSPDALAAHVRETAMHAAAALREIDARE